MICGAAPEAWVQIRGSDLQISAGSLRLSSEAVKAASGIPIRRLQAEKLQKSALSIFVVESCMEALNAEMVR